MDRRSVTGIGMCGLLAALLASPVGAFEPPAPETADLAGAARKLAADIGKRLSKKAPKDGEKAFRVAVFPFGDRNNKYTTSLGINGPILQGELADALDEYLN